MLSMLMSCMSDCCRPVVYGRAGATRLMTESVARPTGGCGAVMPGCGRATPGFGECGPCSTAPAAGERAVGAGATTIAGGSGLCLHGMGPGEKLLRGAGSPMGLAARTAAPGEKDRPAAGPGEKLLRGAGSPMGLAARTAGPGEKDLRFCRCGDCRCWAGCVAVRICPGGTAELPTGVGKNDPFAEGATCIGVRIASGL